MAAPRTFPDLMTESELIDFLRIPEVSNAKDFHHVVENLKRMRDLPRIRISNKPLYLKEAVISWIQKNLES
jgi:hypothetical protein